MRNVQAGVVGLLTLSQCAFGHFRESIKFVGVVGRSGAEGEGVAGQVVHVYRNQSDVLVSQVLGTNFPVRLRKGEAVYEPKFHDPLIRSVASRPGASESGMIDLVASQAKVPVDPRVAVISTTFSFQTTPFVFAQHAAEFNQPMTPHDRDKKLLELSDWAGKSTLSTNQLLNFAIMVGRYYSAGLDDRIDQAEHKKMLLQIGSALYWKARFSDESSRPELNRAALAFLLESRNFEGPVNGGDLSERQVNQQVNELVALGTGSVTLREIAEWKPIF